MDDSVEIRESKVTYTTKELLQRIDGRLDSIERQVGDVPSRKEFDHLESRIDGLEAYRLTLETAAKLRHDTFGYREKIIGIAVAVVLLAVNALTAFHVV